MRKGADQNGGSGVAGEERAQGVTHAAEVVVEIFGFNAPIRQNHPLGAAARRPAGSRVMQVAECKGGGRIAGHRRYVRARINSAVSKSPRSIDEKRPRDQKAETPAHGAEIVNSPRNVSRLNNGSARNTAVCRAAKLGMLR